MYKFILVLYDIQAILCSLKLHTEEMYHVCIAQTQHILVFSCKQHGKAHCAWFIVLFTSQPVPDKFLASAWFNMLVTPDTSSWMVIYCMKLLRIPSKPTILHLVLTVTHIHVFKLGYL